MKQPEIRHPYSKRLKVGIKFGKGLTKQSFKKECDINLILRQYTETGLVTHLRKEPIFGEDHGTDFITTQNALARANTMFENLPPDSRGLFESVSDFIDAIGDPERTDQLVEAGILTQTRTGEINPPEPTLQEEPSTPEDPPQAEPLSTEA